MEEIFKIWRDPPFDLGESGGHRNAVFISQHLSVILYTAKGGAVLLSPGIADPDWLP
jgi:hypothetical protein